MEHNLDADAEEYITCINKFSNTNIQYEATKRILKHAPLIVREDIRNDLKT